MDLQGVRRQIEHVSQRMQEQADRSAEELSTFFEGAKQGVVDGFRLVGGGTLDLVVKGVQGLNFVLGPGVTLSCTPQPKRFPYVPLEGLHPQEPVQPAEAAQSVSPSIPEAPTGSMRERIVHAHNVARSQVTPSPSAPLRPLIWSDAAADFAARWAGNCVYEHSGNRAYGENLYAIQGGSATPEHVVESWASEAPDYAYASNSCAPGKQCGHYTQVVWSATTAVGCAVNKCITGNPFGQNVPWDYWVCSYSPPGNVIGQKPY